jgi:integrase
MLTKSYKIQPYLDSKEHSWAPTTHTTERSRLQHVARLLGGTVDEMPAVEPTVLINALKRLGYTVYATKTTLIRVGELYAFNGDTSVKDWLKQNSRVFKAAYVPRKASMSFADAVQAIERLPTPQMQAFARGLLVSGLRISEAFKADLANGTVVGKGNRVRAVPNAEMVTATPGCSATKFRDELRKLGLTPHMLRKIAATRAVELGAREADLLAIFGWTNMQTASYYVQASRASEVAAKLKEGM